MKSDASKRPTLPGSIDILPMTLCLCSTLNTEFYLNNNTKTNMARLLCKGSTAQLEVHLLAFPIDRAISIEWPDEINCTE